MGKALQGEIFTSFGMRVQRILERLRVCEILATWNVYVIQRVSEECASQTRANSLALLLRYFKLAFALNTLVQRANRTPSNENTLGSDISLLCLFPTLVGEFFEFSTCD